MAPTPSAKSNQGQSTHLKTPTSKHRLHFNSAKITHPSPNPNSALKETPPAEHPVEVVGRIREHPEKKEKPISVLQVNPDRKSLRVRADFGYRDFSFDGVSLSEEEDLDSFYKKFVESRINGVKLGATCTIMMYGPTGSGKSHTMFGCSKQPGIVYRSLKDILSGGGDENGENGDGVGVGVGMFVQVTVLEIYNEEIYDLLLSNGGGGFGLGWTKGGSASKVRLEVMGKKAKNATFISGTEAGKISKEIQKVEKRRIVKSTLCNERSSRSHCMIILDVPTVGGRLMLVDMAGSENIEQAGQIGFEAKMQTAKINQGNIALKRVVESIVNGDSHVPFRDSKLTMLLQDSFEDDNSKILMILCASPDPKEIHKTICTLEYGAKAKCIVRGPHTPIKDKSGTEDCASTVLLGSRIAAMDQFIAKLQMEKKLKEKECNEARKEIEKKDEEVAALRAKLEFIEVKGSGASEEEINLKVNEQTQILKIELEKKVDECQRMANEIVEIERRRMEEKILQHEQEVIMLRRRLEEIESELCRTKDGNGDGNGSRDMVGSSFAKRLMGMYADEDSGMVKSMDLDLDIDHEPFPSNQYESNIGPSFLTYPRLKGLTNVADYDDVFASKHGDRVCLSTVFEEEEVEEGEHKGHFEDEEVEKEIIDEKRVCSTEMGSYGINHNANSFAPQVFDPTGFVSDPENAKDSASSASSRRLRIQNIFTLCGNHRELTQHIATPVPANKGSQNVDPRSSPVFTTGAGENTFVKVLNLEPSNVQRSIPDPEAKNMAPSVESSAKLANELNRAYEGDMTKASKENSNPLNSYTDGQIEVYVKWEALTENPGKFITTLKVVKDASLADLRKLIEIYLGADNQSFTFLVLGDPKGAPVPKEKEASVQAIKLPIFNNQSRGYLACLRPVKGNQCTNNLPLSPLENKLPLTPMPQSTQQRDGFCPKVAKNFSITPLITLPRLI